MNATEIKKEMITMALPIMTAFQTDMVYDFESIDKMQPGDTAYWVFERPERTSLRIRSDSKVTVHTRRRSSSSASKTDRIPYVPNEPDRQ
jgi:hypothetical protein|nr:MAG TPA: hypothetical protein [Caudoviricetes sp.]